MKEEVKRKKGETLEGLRRQLAATEARAEILRVKINRLAATLEGAPYVTTGLDLLWQAAMPTSRIQPRRTPIKTQTTRLYPVRSHYLLDLCIHHKSTRH